MDLVAHWNLQRAPPEQVRVPDASGIHLLFASMIGGCSGRVTCTFSGTLSPARAEWTNLWRLRELRLRVCCETLAL